MNNSITFNINIPFGWDYDYSYYTGNWQLPNSYNYRGKKSKKRRKNRN